MPHYVYVSSQTQASVLVNHILYTVEICMDERIGNILAAQCQCPAGDEWSSAACSHAAATLFAIEDQHTHATEVSCTSQLQQWNKSALKPDSPTLIRDACFNVHKDDKADTTAVVCKPTITYYDPRRPGDSHAQVVKIHDTDASDIENRNAKSEICKPIVVIAPNIKIIHLYRSIEESRTAHLFCTPIP